MRNKATMMPRAWTLLGLLFLLLGPYLASAYSNNYYYNANDYNANDDAAANGDDAAANGDDAAANGDDAAANGDDAAANGDDAAANGDDAAAQGDDANRNDDYEVQRNYDDDRADQTDDDLYHWNANVGFSGVSIMPVSCVNYNNGHMIKFELFDAENSYQCHFASIGTFVVSIAHYMRAYFNYQALVSGRDFQLPGDAGYLNCILLQETAYADTQLYAKIGCMERETYTSTKLSLHVYTDEQCSVPFEDGENSRRHSAKGYEINGYTFGTRVSFRPPFYSCETCSPEEISDTFNKKSGTWYDDDYISSYGSKQKNNDDEEEEGDDAADDYYQDDYTDDAYLAANDDINNGDDDGGQNYAYGGDDYYAGDDGRRNLVGSLPALEAASGQLETYEQEFWEEVEGQRKLYDENYDVGDWNMCQRMYKYGVWCDEDCRSLDSFRRDGWSGADIILLSIMCTFLTAMMLLIVAKRLKASQKARAYGEQGLPMPGLPPAAMTVLFSVVMIIVVVFAKLKFVNETLVFAVVTCILLFIYMLKLTLFDNRRPVLLAAPRHEVFDSNLDGHLFD